MNSNLRVSIIYGKAGTGKTRALTNLVRKLENGNYSYIVLAPTHNAINNIFQRLNSEQKYEKRLKTLHAYFRINYKNNNNMLGPKHFIPNIIIDEFSLIHRQVLINILEYFKNTTKNKNVKLYLFGDPLQLNAVYETDLENIISFKELIRLDNLTQNILRPRALKHVYQSNFYNTPITEYLDKDKIELKKLTTNHRAGETVMSTLVALFNNDITFSYNFISKFNICRELSKEKTYFIASNYEILQDIYDKLAVNYYSQQPGYVKIKQFMQGCTGFSTLHLYPGCIIRSLETNDSSNIYNGQILCIQHITDNYLQCFDINTHEEVIVQADKPKELEDETTTTTKTSTYMSNSERFFHVGPYNLLTVHKSQGYTLDNVIVCFDKMFEISMLYTAVTRASNTISFYTNNSENDYETNVKELINTMYSNDLLTLEKLSLN